MVAAAEKAGVTNSVIRAEVAPNGKVSLSGSWKKGAKNPIVEVNYENNRELNFSRHGVYATNVVKALQKRYGIKNEHGRSFFRKYFDHLLYATKWT